MNWLDDWFGYTRHDKLVTLGMIVSAPLFTGYIAARACCRKLFGVEQ